MTKPHDRDSTIGEIHRTRERLAAKFGHDIKAILADARHRQAESGHPVWQGKPAGKPSDKPGEPGS
jgi:hypothetical protein